MAEKPKLEIVPKNADDIENLWLDSALGDGITDAHWHAIPVGKPRDFFRVHPDKDFRRRTEIFVLKREDEIEQQYFVIDPAMRGRLPEARPCVIVPCIYRDGSPRLWPIPFPRVGEKDNEAWTSARLAARVAIDKWVKLVWVRRAYLTRDAHPGYAPDPDWSKLPSLNDMVKIALGEHGIMRNEDHPVFREQMGCPAEAAGGDDDDL
jgi:hypothetical protein